ncbi:hypothetical protein CJU60_00230 [Bacillus sp. 7705b]|nr:hypothetical protein CJU60_00230 [Bacillus sp. 7705b]
MHRETLKFILTLFAVYATIQVTNEIGPANYWFLKRLIQFLICIVVFLVITFIFPPKKNK